MTVGDLEAQLLAAREYIMHADETIAELRTEVERLKQEVKDSDCATEAWRVAFEASERARLAAPAKRRKPRAKTPRRQA